jgi:hypothetical protein
MLGSSSGIVNTRPQRFRKRGSAFCRRDIEFLNGGLIEARAITYRAFIALPGMHRFRMVVPPD